MICVRSAVAAAVPLAGENRQTPGPPTPDRVADLAGATQATLTQAVAGAIPTQAVEAAMPATPMQGVAAEMRAILTQVVAGAIPT